MDVDAGFIAAVCRDGKRGVATGRRYEVRELLRGPAVLGWEFVLRHFGEFGHVPTPELVEQTVEDLKLPPPEKTEVIDFYVAEMRFRNRQQMWEKLGPDIGDLVRNQRLDRAEEKVRDFLRGQSQDVSKEFVRSVWSLGAEVKKRYLDRKEGRLGVPYPWPSMNDLTLGSEVGDVNGFIARLGIGKTMIMLLSAYHAWKVAGAKVLFVSPEMKQVALAMRLISYDLRLPYGAIRRGRLDDFLEAKFFEALDKMSDLPGFMIVADKYRISTDLIDAAIEQTEPTVVYIDGAYLVLTRQGISRIENAEIVADWMLGAAKRHGVPFNFSTQFNRAVKTDDPETLLAENIGLSDAFGQNADNLFFLYQTKDMKADREMGMKPAKLREAYTNNDILIHWDWEQMNFDEIGKEGNNYEDKDFERYGSGGAPEVPEGEEEFPF